MSDFSDSNSESSNSTSNNHKTHHSNLDEVYKILNHSDELTFSEVWNLLWTHKTLIAISTATTLVLVLSILYFTPVYYFTSTTITKASFGNSSQLNKRLSEVPDIDLDNSIANFGTLLSSTENIQHFSQKNPQWSSFTINAKASKTPLGIQLYLSVRSVNSDIEKLLHSYLKHSENRLLADYNHYYKKAIHQEIQTLTHKEQSIIQEGQTLKQDKIVALESALIIARKAKFLKPMVQVFNKETPLYLLGSRLISAELVALKSTEDVKPLVYRKLNTVREKISFLKAIPPLPNTLQIVTTDTLKPATSDLLFRFGAIIASLIVGMLIGCTLVMFTAATRNKPSAFSQPLSPALSTN